MSVAEGSVNELKRIGLRLKRVDSQRQGISVSYPSATTRSPSLLNTRDV